MTSFPIPSNYANHILVASPSTVVRQRVLESLRSPVRRFEPATGGAEALVHLESGFWQVLFLESPPARPRRRGTEPDRQGALPERSDEYGANGRDSQSALNQTVRPGD